MTFQWIIARLWMKSALIHRLNSRVRNSHNFFLQAIFLLRKIGTDSVNYADSGDIKILIQLPGNSILEFSSNFWNCVGATLMRRCFRRVSFQRRVISGAYEVKITIGENEKSPRLESRIYRSPSSSIVKVLADKSISNL